MSIRTKNKNPIRSMTDYHTSQKISRHHRKSDHKIFRVASLVMVTWWAGKETFNHMKTWSTMYLSLHLTLSCDLYLWRHCKTCFLKTVSISRSHKMSSFLALRRCPWKISFGLVICCILTSFPEYKLLQGIFEHFWLAFLTYSLLVVAFCRSAGQRRSTILFE